MLKENAKPITKIAYEFSSDSEDETNNNIKIEDKKFAKEVCLSPKIKKGLSKAMESKNIRMRNIGSPVKKDAKKTHQISKNSKKIKKPA